MPKSLDELSTRVEHFIKDNRLNDALVEIQKFVELILECHWCTGIVYSSEILDSLCQKIGSLTCPQEMSPEVSEKDTVVYIATELYMTGGHSAVIEEFIEGQPHCHHAIFLTNIKNTAEKTAIQKRFGNSASVNWAPDGSLEQKLIWLQNQLKKHSKSKTFLFNHHQDSVAIAAVQPSLTKKLLFYHHGDHHLQLGVHLKHAKHIDPHSFGFYNCRNHLNVSNNIHLPLVCKDHGTYKKSFLTRGYLTTCSAGSQIKFESPYLYSYSEMLPKMLKKTSGIHIHIGPLSGANLSRIHQNLKEAGIKKENFIHIEWVECLWNALIDHDVDLYIASFPYIGLKSCIEAMGAGIPLITHQNYSSQLLGGSFYSYPEAYSWKTPEELFTFLENLDPGFLSVQSQLARSHYQKHHQPQLVNEILNQPYAEMQGTPPPPLPKFSLDNFQISLDLAHFCLKVKKNMLEKDHQTKELVKAIEKTAAQLNTVQIQLAKVYQSLSWRITYPLRLIKNRTDNFFKHLINYFREAP